MNILAPRAPDLTASALLDALSEPAAICAEDGAVLWANPSWRRMAGPGRRLPGGGRSLYGAFVRARREGRGEGTLEGLASPTLIAIARLDAGRYLLRARPASVPQMDPPRPPPAPPPPAPGAMEVFAAASPFGAALIDGADPFSGAIVAVNPALSQIAGPGARPGATLSDLLTAPTRDEAAGRHGAGAPGPYEVALARHPATIVHLYLAGAGGQTTAYLLDVTEQKRMQLQLAQRNKMEAVGQLAGGVAHDFNNLLTAINLRVGELLLRHSLGDPSYENLSEIRETVVRAADMVGQLLTFSRKATIRRESLDLGEVLGGLEVLLRRLLREDVTLETHYGAHLPRVRADKAQLENAVMNLVVNARDAITGGGVGGVIRLSVARVDGAAAQALGYPGPGAEALALIEVADDGPGMAADVVANIFEPFFTTKPVGEGTGLGLATVYGVVKQSDGFIIVRSSPGAGATFRIFLPPHTPPLTVEQPAAAASGRIAARDLSGAGRILFVEDEPSVRGIAARLLRARGYEVIEARDGEEALALAKQHAGSIDLMISDVIMPGMDGPTLLKQARPYLGDAPVMFISGYAEAEFSDLLEGEAGVSFLAKPLDIKVLSERVKQRLQGG